jgi:hypothetical protein
MPMIATTIISSMSVKPFWTAFIEQLLGLDRGTKQRRSLACDVAKQSVCQWRQVAPRG